MAETFHRGRVLGAGGGSRSSGQHVVIFHTDPSVAADGSMSYFGSDRPGGVGGQDLWQTPILPIVDFNGDKIVNLRDFAILAQHWQEEESSVDIGPTPLGDQVVDARDVAVLAQYWLTDYRVIAHWKLDESAGNRARDSVGGYDGMVQGNPTWQPHGGKLGGAIQLDGIDDCIATNPVLSPADGPLQDLRCGSRVAPRDKSFYRRRTVPIGFVPTRRVV